MLFLFYIEKGIFFAVIQETGNTNSDSGETKQD